MTRSLTSEEIISAAASKAWTIVLLLGIVVLKYLGGGDRQRARGSNGQIVVFAKRHGEALFKSVQIRIYLGSELEVTVSAVSLPEHFLGPSQRLSKYGAS